MTARRAVDFPEPDSPTSPTTSFGESVRLNSLTAGGARRHRETHREFLISRRASGIAEGAWRWRRSAQALAQEVEKPMTDAQMASAGPATAQNDTLMYFCAS